MKAALFAACRTFAAGERGQVSTEMMLLISVVSIAVVAALLSFDTPFREGMSHWGDAFVEVYGAPGDPVP